MGKKKRKARSERQTRAQAVEISYSGRAPTARAVVMDGFCYVEVLDAGAQR